MHVDGRDERWTESSTPAMHGNRPTRPAVRPAPGRLQQRAAGRRRPRQRCRPGRVSAAAPRPRPPPPLHPRRWAPAGGSSSQAGGPVGRGEAAGRHRRQHAHCGWISTPTGTCQIGGHAPATAPEAPQTSPGIPSCPAVCTHLQLRQRIDVEASRSLRAGQGRAAAAAQRLKGAERAPRVEGRGWGWGG